MTLDKKVPRIRDLIGIIDQRQGRHVDGENRQNVLAVLEGRVVREGDCVVALEPSPLQFHKLFPTGAAFYLDQNGDLSVGGSASGSIDHTTIARAFGLDAEAARGFITPAQEVCIEAWARHSAEDMIAPQDEVAIRRTIEDAMKNAPLQRIARSWRLIVYNADYLEIADRVLADDAMNVFEDSAAPRRPLPAPGEKPWWVDALAPMTRQLRGGGWS